MADLRNLPGKIKDFFAQQIAAIPQFALNQIVPLQQNNILTQKALSTPIQSGWKPDPNGKGYLPVFNEPAPFRYLPITNSTSTPSPIPTATPTQPQNTSYIHQLGGVNVPQYLRQPIMETFNPLNQATASAQVLNHPLQQQNVGVGRGENPGFVTGKGWNDFNYDQQGNLNYIVNPFTQQQEPSEDRGLFRINNATFYDYQRRLPNTLKKLGINSYQDMYDPVKNIKMAGLIYQNQGWSAFMAAPTSLLTQK